MACTCWGILSRKVQALRILKFCKLLHITSGHENMTMLDKVIYVADYIEPGRKFPGVEEARKLCICGYKSSFIICVKENNSILMERSDDLSINIPNIQCSYQGGNE